jgi:hypothetical protein
LVNWKAGLVRNGSKLHRCCIRLVTLLWRVVVVVEAVFLGKPMAELEAQEDL